jgi:DNA-binding IclR family transcriptional regulator
VACRRIKSAERTLALFEMFSKHQRPMTVGCISAELNIPQPSASMLVRNLTEMGYLDHDRVKRTFVPSLRLVLLGSWIPQRYSAAGMLATRLDELHKRTGGETAYIGIQNGATAQLVLWLNSAHHTEAMVVESGMYRSLTCSSTGRALLCRKPDDEIAVWVKRCNAEATEDRFKVRLADYMKVMDADRERGYSMTAGEIQPGVSAIATTISSPMGGTPLAIGLSAPIDQMQTKKGLILEALQEFKEGFDALPLSSGRATDQAPAGPLETPHWSLLL